MNTNGLSLYNVGNSLDLEALTRAGPQNDSHDDDDSDDDGEEEVKKRNAELQDLLTNAFDDLIEEEEATSELEATNHEQSGHALAVQNLRRLESPKFPLASNHEFPENSLYSPLHLHQGDLLSETQYPGTGSPNVVANLNSLKQHDHKNQYDSNGSHGEQHYLSSGLNSQAELEILYEARGSEINKLTKELHQLQHKAALAEGEKNGMKMTLESSERILRDTREENRRLSEEIQSVNQKLVELIETNNDLSAKLEASENNAITLERQILNLNLLDANHRDANRQEVLLSGMKARYENDLRTLRDELTRLRTELEYKNESIISLERKLRDVTDMHERTLQERAANLQEFNRALDQQRVLREQRDSLTSATLLDQLSRAQEEIERLKNEKLSQNMSDSMSQLRIAAPNYKDHSVDSKQAEQTIRSMEQRLLASENALRHLEETNRQLSKEKEGLKLDLARTIEEKQSVVCEKNRFVTELNSVKELYLNVCREKDLVEEDLQKLASEKGSLESQRKQLLKDLEDVNSQMEENLNRHKTLMEANWESKLQTAIQEQVARARLEWLKEKNRGQNEDFSHVEKSLSELQCLRETMDALRSERDSMQNELMRRQQQLKLERHLLREKFAIEKEMLIKTWQEKVNAASAAAVEKAESLQQDKSVLTATADAMARLRQQCEEEKLSIIASYEKQLLELQSSNSSTPLQGTRTAQGSDWRLDLSKVKMSLKNHQVSADVLLGFDNAIQKLETLWLRDQKSLQDQTEKYKQLKRRVRDYQKYVNEKLAKCKSDREQSEAYCRRVISELLGKVTQELQKLEVEQQNANRGATNLPPHSVGPGVNKATTNGCLSQQHPESTFAQGIDDLREQVNRYVLGLTNFNNLMK